MKKTILITLFLLLSCQVKFPVKKNPVSSTTSIISSVSEEDFQGFLDFRKVLSGEKSSVKKFETRIIKNESDLQKLWDAHTGSSNNPVFLPKIDFQQKFVVAIFLGDKPTTNFKIDIAKIYESKKDINIYLSEITPPTGIEVKDETIQPFLFIEIKKSNKTINFDTSSLLIKNEFEKVPFQVLESGTDSGIKNFSKIVVRNDSEFFDFFKNHLSEKEFLSYNILPEVNLKKDNIIGIFLGERSSARYSLEIIDVSKNKESVVIKANEYLNGESNISKKIYPYQMIKIPQTNLQVKFDINLLASSDINNFKDIPKKSKEIIFKPFASGNNSKIKEEKSISINDRNDFIRAWQEHSIEEVPNIDFSSSQLIGYFLGEKKSNGYFVKIKSIIENEKDMRIFLEITNLTNNNSNSSNNITTNPYDLIIMPKTNKNLVFITNNVVKE